MSMCRNITCLYMYVYDVMCALKLKLISVSTVKYKGCGHTWAIPDTNTWRGVVTRGLHPI